MIETIQQYAAPILPYASMGIMGFFAIYILYKSKFLKNTKKMAENSTSATMFWKLYMILMKQLLIGIGTWLLKYSLYMALYGFIIYNIYNILGFEMAVLFGIVLTVSRVQMKRTHI